MNVRNMKSAVAVLAMSLAGVASAITANGPICDTAARVGYPSTGSYTCTTGIHNAVDMNNRTCSEWNSRGMLVGTYHYQYFGGCVSACGGGSTCNSGMGNYHIVTGANGWDFRQLHLNANVNSYSKTCDSCVLGLVGATGPVDQPHVHADNRQYATRKTAWYTEAGTVCGSSAYCGNVIGYPTL
jgi:hypothetical protein